MKKQEVMQSPIHFLKRQKDPQGGPFHFFLFFAEFGKYPAIIINIMRRHLHLH